jgi:DNA polymerase III alpha subunit
MQDNFINFNCKTYYSLMQSLIAPKQLLEKSKELGQSAIAVADQSSMLANWDLLKYAKELGDIKPIIGLETNFVNNILDEEKGRIRHLILIAKNANGYRNLLNLSRVSYDYSIINFKKVIPRIDWSILEKYSSDLICLTGGATGILGQLINTRQEEEATKQAARLKEIFGENLGLEVQAHTLTRQANNYCDYIDQNLTNNTIIKIAEKIGAKIIPTTVPMYLEPSQAETHDISLAVGSGQPVRSNARMRFVKGDGSIVAEFYPKTREQVLSFFKRLYKDKAALWCDNTMEFADQCEFPNWIDPAFSNPSKKELPEFPVKNQTDYVEFISWRNSHTEYNDLKDDEAYIRFKCQSKLDALGLLPEDKQKYIDQLNLELELFDFKGFNSYFEIVQDYLLFCDKNGYRRGPGRGCLSGDSLVLTKDGFCPLANIKKNDYVFTHTGKLQKVINTFEYNINEECHKIYSDYSIKPIVMTKDHKVYGYKSIITTTYKKASENRKSSLRKFEPEGPPSWIAISNLNVGDCIFNTFPNREIIEFNSIDLSKFSHEVSFIDDNYVYQNIPLKNEFAIRCVKKATGLSRNTLKKIKSKQQVESGTTDKLSNYLAKFNLSVNDWADLNNTKTKKINRFISFNKDFTYFLGRWAGDGWYSVGNSHQTGLAFHSDDEKSIAWFTSYFEGLGLEVYRKNSTDGKKLVQLYISNKLVTSLLKFLFPDYKRTSRTKHFPVGWRNFNNELLNSFLLGLRDSDGYVEKSGRICYDTTSPEMAQQIKEAFLYLKMPSGITVRKPWKRGKYLCRQSYKVHIGRATTFSHEGYYSRITKIEKEKLSKVYDIHVENDHSYLTSNYVVHNSVAGSLAAFLLGIHEADPIKYKLIFERFLNKEKVAFPDIDCDFSKEHKKAVELYIKNKYGYQKVAGISNILTLTPKPYIKAIARVFQYGGDFKTAVKIGMDIADLVPSDLGDIDEVIEQCPIFNEYAKKYPELIKYKDLCGAPIAFGTHAAGLIIGKRDLADIVPVRKDKEGNVVLEYEKERAEENGLIKMDILGLETLDIIKSTEDLIRKNNKEVPVVDYHTFDQAAYDLISRGDTFTVFQLGTSGGTIDLCRRIKPKNIEDISIINALARPSAATMRDDFIETKEGRKKYNLLHPKLERAFKSTYGFGLFEESLMYLAQDIAGWSLNEADKLRKLTKDKGKYPEKVAKWKQEFIEGSVKNNVDRKIATRIWEDVVEGFQGYGFNLSHSTLYSLISYHTAYLKAHFPLEFLTANLIAEANSNTKDAPKNALKIKSELRQLKIKIIPPDINKSQNTYSIIDEHTIMAGLDALKFIGKDAIPEILSKRPFSSFDDFITRVDGRKVRAPAIQALAAAGALDSFNMPRNQMFLYAADYKKKLKMWQERRAEETFVYPFPNEMPWTDRESFALEIKYLGEGLIGSAETIYPDFFDRKTAINFVEMRQKFPTSMRSELPAKYGIFQAIVEDFFEFKVKKEDSKIKGQIMARLTLKDLFGNSIGAVLFPEALETFRKKLKTHKIKMIEPGLALHLGGIINWYEGEASLSITQLKKVMGIPELPKELKPQSIKMKIERIKKDKKKATKIVELLDELDDELVEQGLSEPEDEEYFDISELEDYKEPIVLED